MDQKTLDNLMNSVEQIMSNQKKLEIKVNIIEDTFANIQNSLSEHWDQVGHLEADQLRVIKLIKKTDLKIQEFEEAITRCVKNIELMKAEPEKQLVENSDVLIVKRHLKQNTFWRSTSNMSIQFLLSVMFAKNPFTKAGYLKNT